MVRLDLDGWIQFNDAGLVSFHLFGGVLGAMDTMYQRGKIQDESMYYEHKKHDGSLPLIGVNTFLPKDHGGEIATEIELIRSTPEEKGRRLRM